MMSRDSSIRELLLMMMMRMVKYGLIFSVDTNLHIGGLNGMV